MDIREIERLVDEEHWKSPIFKHGKNQSYYYLLSSFEELCKSNLSSSILNPSKIFEIRNLMDALNIALIWADSLCIEDNTDIDAHISDDIYRDSCELLYDYAYPYSVICTGYISYSRNSYDATVNDNTVIFDIRSDQNNSLISDLIREGSNSDIGSMAKLIPTFKLLNSVSELKKHISVEDGEIGYINSQEVSATYREIATHQWDVTRTLPTDWEFELFSLEDYKKFWISVTALCYIHFCSGLTITDSFIRRNNGVIKKSRKLIIDYIEYDSKLDRKTIDNILNYLTFNPKKKNVDIMYQPIVSMQNDMILISPNLFMGSNPERNLLSVVSTMNDKKYFNNVNGLETVMVSELESAVSYSCIAKHKKLREDLPDVDFAIYDEETNSALICEVKWFAAADSTKEVFAKEDEITHGCKQAEDISTYAMSDKKAFVKQVFQADTDEAVDILCCVVAKNNIRTRNSKVAVIDLKRIKELFSKHPLNDVINIIRNHEYEIPLAPGMTVTHKDIKYAGFTFKIPAIGFEF